MTEERESKPDPTILVTDLVMREIAHLHDLMLGRIEFLEKAQEKAAEALALAVDKTEVRVNEKLSGLKDGFDASLGTLSTLMSANADKITQVDKDRALYVTRDLLETALKAFPDLLPRTEYSVQHAALEEKVSDALVQAATFMSRDEAAALIDGVISKVETLKDLFPMLMPRAEYSALHRVLEERVDVLADSVTTITTAQTERRRIDQTNLQTRQVSSVVLFGIVSAIIGVAGIISAVAVALILHR